MRLDSLGTELAPISAAIASSNAQADLDLNLLARVEVQPNEMLEIYEPVPGRLLVSGVGAPAGEALLSAHAVEGLPVEDIWNLATGSTEMPGELRAAIVRASKRKDPPGFNPQPDPPGFNPQPEQSISSGWCDTGYYSSGYGNCSSGSDFSICIDNWWNGAYGYYDGAFYVYTNVCPATGPVVLKVTSDHGGGGIWTVSQNTVRWWQQDDWDCGTLWDWDCLTVRADVQEASGDRFHFRFFGLDG